MLDVLDLVVLGPPGSHTTQTGGCAIIMGRGADNGPPQRGQQRTQSASHGRPIMGRGTVAVAALGVLAGGFVAGLKAGFDYNTFPLMDGRLGPEGYGKLAPCWLNWTENVAAVQFNHRLLATATLLLALGTLLAGWHSAARPVLLGLAGTVGVQYGLGIATLVHVVPVGLGTLHQAMAVVGLTAALGALDRPRGRASRL